MSAGADQPSVLRYAFVPVVIFWALDGYYLDQERAYRRLYDRVRDPEYPADFSLDARGLTGSHGWRKACFSKTLVWFYGLIAITIAALLLLA